MKIIKPNPNEISFYDFHKSSEDVAVFLAGSIEMGVAENWQEKVIKELKNIDNIYFSTKRTLAVCNPRRDNWDSSWEQKQSDYQFNFQVNWEQAKLEESDIIFMYFSPDTKSPISLLEFGQFVGSDKHEMIVCCPDGFWRKGNIEIMCTRNNVALYHTLDDAIGALNTILPFHL